MALKYLILSYITEVLLEILNIRMSSFRDCCNTKALLAKKKLKSYGKILILTALI